MLFMQFMLTSYSSKDLVFGSFEQQVSDPDEFDFSYEFFNSCDTKFVPANSIFLVDFSPFLRLILLIVKP